MKKQTILSAYTRARDMHGLNVSFLKRPPSQLPRAIEEIQSRLHRRARQMETFAARLAVVQPTKRDALSDDTPFNEETPPNAN